MFKMVEKMRSSRSEEGFTLIELMIVVVIIGVLAAIAIPIFSTQQKAAIDAQTRQDLKNARTAFSAYLAKHGGRIAPDAVIRPNGERNIYTTEGSLNVYYDPDLTEPVIVNPNNLDIVLSEGTHLRIYDRYTADGGIGFEQGIYYVQAWNPNGAKHASYETRIVFNGNLNITRCFINSGYQVDC